LGKTARDKVDNHWQVAAKNASDQVSVNDLGTNVFQAIKKIADIIALVNTNTTSM
jgi:hypothetical protein